MNSSTIKIATASLIVKKTGNGKGVFAVRNFSKDDTVFEVHGDIYYTIDEQPNRYGQGEEDRTVQIGENLFLGPTGDFDDFMNHSCEPNTALLIPDKFEKRVSYVAIRDIEANEEITWDYSTTMYGDDWEMECLCGSASCSRRIREFRFLPEEIQQKYIRMGIVPEYILRIIHKNMMQQLPQRHT